MKYLSLKQSSLCLTLLCASLFLIPTDLMSQRNRGVKSKRYKKAYRVKSLPKARQKVRFGNKNYYYNRGAFYRKTRNGYRYVKAPIGYRLKRLPRGYRSYYWGNRMYYYYWGNYYWYHPRHKVYIVVDAPDEEDAERVLEQDEIILSNGKTFYGKFVKADDKTVTMEINGESKEFKLEKVISINYASPLEEENDDEDEDADDESEKDDT